MRYDLNQAENLLLARVKAEVSEWLAAKECFAHVTASPRPSVSTAHLPEPELTFDILNPSGEVVAAAGWLPNVQTFCMGRGLPWGP